MRHCLHLICFITLSTFLPVSLDAAPQERSECKVEVVENNNRCVNLSFVTEGFSMEEVDFQGERYARIVVEDQGETTNLDESTLPAISRYVVIPPRAGIRLEVNCIETRRVDSLPPPKPAQSDAVDFQTYSATDLYPAQAVEISTPVVMRSIRMAMITVHPVQYDLRSGSYLHHVHIDVRVCFTDDPPVNPVIHAENRANRSSEFDNLIRSLAVNGDHPNRDEGEIGRDYIGHYLVVAHDSCLQYAIPFIEWRRRSGYKVDILRFSHEDATDDEIIMEGIQSLYDEYLDQGVDPFDHILLLGDRYDRNSPQSIWQMGAPVGNPSMDNTPAHADYRYGCLEGEDLFPDVAVGRFASGNEDRMELAVGRTLGYEMTPEMEDTEWFNRAGVFSETWTGFDWTLVYTVRWGEEALRERGFSEILIQETDGIEDQTEIGEALTEWFNDGLSLMIGRAELGYWNADHGGVQRFGAVNTNTVFPILISAASHGEFGMNTICRTGDGENLKGPAAMITGWGTLTTIHNNGFWLGMISGLLNHDMSLGWSKVFAGVSFLQMFPNWGAGMNTYLTDTDLFGDPGIKPWIGIPQTVEARYPEAISPGTDHIEVTVFREDSDDVVADAQVTIYAPGDLPGVDEYHEWQPQFMVTSLTDASGKARLPFDPAIEDGIVYLTVTGRDILPLLEEIEIAEEATFISISDYEIDDSRGGNDDGNINPGETITIEFTATNHGNRVTALDVQARVLSRSPYLTVVQPDSIVFGDISAGESAAGNRSVTVAINPGCPDQCEPELYVDFTSTQFVWRSIIKLDVWGVDLQVNAIQDSLIVTDDERNLDIEVVNNGRIAAPALRAELLAQDYGVIVLNSEANYAAINPGETALTNGDPFRVVSRNLTIPGNTSSMMLVFFNDDEPVDTSRFELQSQRVRQDAPLGPDDYGYYCYDDTDEDWLIAPEYEWLEYSPYSIVAIDWGTIIERFNEDNNNAAEVIELPFNFRFYGRDYNHITVGINGFIGVGEQPRIVNPQNFPTEKAIAGPMGTIAPLWTRLTTSGRQRPRVVYYYDDSERGHKFIVEWYNLHFYTERTEYNLNFEVVLFDPEYYPTATGDADILFLYKTVRDCVGIGEDNPYASVGISSPDGKTGIRYAYNNQYPPSAAVLRNRRAILFTTNLGFAHGITRGTVNDSETGNPVSDAVIKGYSDFGIAASGISNDDGEFELVGMFGLPGIRFEGIRSGYRGTRFELDTLVEGSDSILVAELYLLQPEIRLRREEIREYLAPSHKTRHYVGLFNRGTGPLEFIASLNEPDQQDNNDAGNANSDDNHKTRHSRINYTEWIDLEPRTGYLNPDEYTNLILTYDTRGLEAGDYERQIVIEDTLADIRAELPIFVNIDEDNGLIDPSGQPLEWSLEQNYPNPFNATATINYTIKEAGFINLTIFDIRGRKVVRLMDEYHTAGRYSVILDRTILPAGVYLYRLETGAFTATKEMILIK